MTQLDLVEDICSRAEDDEVVEIGGNASTEIETGFQVGVFDVIKGGCYGD